MLESVETLLLCVAIDLGQELGSNILILADLLIAALDVFGFGNVLDCRLDWGYDGNAEVLAGVSVQEYLLNHILPFDVYGFDLHYQ